MTIVKVCLGSRSYPIFIGSNLLPRLGEFFSEAGIGRRVFLVSNPTVGDLYSARIKESLAKAGYEVTDLSIPDGETYKTLETAEKIYTDLIVQKADRNSTLVALGGGVTGDIVGFVAATFLRGVPYVQIPTTLLAQVDSAVGGKTGVNHRLGKNLLGAFYQPVLVCSDLDTLSTLPPRDFQAGLYEVIKYGLIRDSDFFSFFCDQIERTLSREPDVLEKIISRSCEIKADITSRDERESELRRILNFGHTFGHAIEAALDYEEVKHGEAVGYGMIAAAVLSRELDLLDSDNCSRVVDSILSIGALPRLELPFESLEEAMWRDKKRQDDRIVFILLSKIGATTAVDSIEAPLLQAAWSEALNRVHGQ